MKRVRDKETRQDKPRERPVPAAAAPPVEAPGVEGLVWVWELEER